MGKKRRLKRDMISGFCISTHEAQRVKPEPESKHCKKDLLRVREDAGMGCHGASGYPCSWECRPGDPVRDIRDRFRALGEGMDAKGPLTLGSYDLLVGILSLLPSAGIQSSGLDLGFVLYFTSIVTHNYHCICLGNHRCPSKVLP